MSMNSDREVMGAYWKVGNGDLDQRARSPLDSVTETWIIITIIIAPAIRRR
jgi:hypothetical protein